MCIFGTITQCKGGPMGLNFEGFKMQKWSKPVDRSERVDKKNRVVCLVIMFTSRVIVIKMWKIALFIFCPNCNWFFAVIGRITKISHFYYFNGCDPGSKHDPMDYYVIQTSKTLEIWKPLKKGFRILLMWHFYYFGI